MPLPAAARLFDFGPLTQLEEGRSASAAPDRRHSPGRRAGDPETTEALVARARAEGIIAGRAEMEAVLTAQEAASAAQLAEARAAWVEEEGAEIARRLDSAMSGLNEKLQGSVAVLLLPFLEDRLRVSAVSDLAATLDVILASSEGTRIHVSGPEDLLARLRANLGTRVEQMAFETSDAIDLTVVADKTVIETRVAAWLDRLHGGG